MMWYTAGATCTDRIGDDDELARHMLRQVAEDTGKGGMYMEAFEHDVDMLYTPSQLLRVCSTLKLGYREMFCNWVHGQAAVTRNGNSSKLRALGFVWRDE